MRKKRYSLIAEDYQEIIRDNEAYENIFYVAQSGMGTRRKHIELAKKVVDFLNAEAETEQRNPA